MPVLLTAVLAALALVPAACGGEGGEQDATALLDRAFDQPIPSADVDIDLQLDVDGLDGLEDPLRIRAAGPYVRSKGTLPKLDMDLEVGAQGAGQSIESGLLSTGDRVFLRFGGAYYEQPRKQVARANRRLAEGRGDGGSLGDLGLDPRSWIVDASIEGEEEVGGAMTRHVTGTLDVAAAVRDLNELVKQSSGALGDSEQAPKPLGERELERLSRSVEDPTFDVYIGRDDDVVRRLSLRLTLSVPEQDREDVGGITGASIRFAVELSDVGGDQQVTAPRESRPLSELTQQLGGLGGLTGTGGLDTLPGGGAVAPDAGGADAGSDDRAAEALERYGECLEQAAP
ncbi:MAG: hypothetical protein WD399_01855, partial [Thermoleophilaceae bacterium]